MVEHKATPEQWGLVEQYADVDCYYDSCILELRARVEALEAQQQEQQWPTLAATAPASAGSLVELLESEGYGRTHARAAIRVVAKWLRENDRGMAATWLEQEADRG